MLYEKGSLGVYKGKDVDRLSNVPPYTQCFLSLPLLSNCSVRSRAFTAPSLAVRPSFLRDAPTHRLASDTSHQSLTIPTSTTEKKSLIVLPSVTGARRVHPNVLLSDPVHTLVCHAQHISGIAAPSPLLFESFQLPSPTAAYWSSSLDLTISCCS